jgi:dihydropteroate synthase
VNDDARRHMVYRIGGREFDFSERTYLMGVLNVTPDSFSDGGKYLAPDLALEHARSMIEEGADIIDVGGESTRPRGAAYGEGSEPVSGDDETRRVIPVIERLVRETNVPLSIDTYKSDVARRALDVGAVIVNDISGFHFDPAMAPVVAAAGATAVIMHIKGMPWTMPANPTYDDLFAEVMGYLREGLRIGGGAGIRQMIVDPGIGFGKRQEHNLQLIAGLRALRQLGCPVLVGPSRKAFIGSILDLPVDQRLEGTLAAIVAAVLNGANVIRVHDVREAKRAVMVADAIRQASAPYHVKPPVE